MLSHRTVSMALSAEMHGRGFLSQDQRPGHQKFWQRKACFTFLWPQIFLFLKDTRKLDILFIGKPPNPTTQMPMLEKDVKGEDGSQPASYLMKEGAARQSWCPRAGACVFHVDIVHGWQFGNLSGFAAAAAAATARARRALPFLSYEFVQRSVRV